MTNLEIVNLLQRITGIVALGLLALQIYRGTNKFLVYAFVFIHPVFYLITKYFTYRKIDFYYTFVDTCVLCPSTYDYFINFGRLAFYLVTITVFIVYFKNTSNWLKTNWKKLYFLNYIAFYFVSIHSILLGTDAKKPLFLAYFIILQIIVLMSARNRLHDLKITNSKK